MARKIRIGERTTAPLCEAPEIGPVRQAEFTQKLRSRNNHHAPRFNPVISPSYSAGLEFELTGVAQSVEVA